MDSLKVKIQLLMLFMCVCGVFNPL